MKLSLLYPLRKFNFVRKYQQPCHANYLKISFKSGLLGILNGAVIIDQVYIHEIFVAPPAIIMHQKLCFAWFALEESLHANP